MNSSQLAAVQTDEKPQKIRRCGFIPGIVYGKGLEQNLRVKFRKADVDNIISVHGERARVSLDVDGKKYVAFLKEVQKANVSNECIHIDLQVVSSQEDIRVKVPIVFEGVSKLEFNKLLLETYKQNVELYGNAEKIPEQIKLDVSAMKAGKHITFKDFALGSEIRVHDSNEVIAVICKKKEFGEPGPEAETKNEQ